MLMIDAGWGVPEVEQGQKAQFSGVGQSFRIQEFWSSGAKVALSVTPSLNFEDLAFESWHSSDNFILYLPGKHKTKRLSYFLHLNFFPSH